MSPGPPKEKRRLGSAALSNESKLRIRYPQARALQAQIWSGWLQHARKLADEYRRTRKAPHLQAFRNHFAEMRNWRLSRARRRFYIQQVSGAMAQGSGIGGIQ